MTTEWMLEELVDSTDISEGWKVQGSEEWLATRKNHLGASEVASVLGLNSYDQIHHLLNEKLSTSEKATPLHTWRGKEQEQAIVQSALNWIRSTENSTMTGAPDVVVGAGPWSFLRASLDWISTDRTTLIEVKCPEVLPSQIPPMYYAQCQIQMFVTGASRTLFRSQTATGEYFQEWIFPSLEWLNTSLPKLQDFWHKYVVNKEPLISELEAEIQNQEFEDMLDELEEKNKALKVLEKRVEEIKARIRSELRADSTKIGKWLIRLERAKGAVDYSRIPQLSGVETEKYRKADTIRMKVVKS